MRNSLRNRVLLLVMFPVASLVGALLLYMTHSAGDQIHDATQAKVRSTAFVLSQLLNERSAFLGDRCEALAKQPASLGYRTGFDSASRSAKRAVYEVRADALMLTSARGKLLGDSSYVRGNGSVLKPKKYDMSDRDHVRSAMKGKSWKGVVTRGNGLFLAVSVPVRSGGRIVMTLTAYKRLDVELAQQMKRALMTDVAFLHGNKVLASTLKGKVALPPDADKKTEIKIGRRAYFVAYSALPGTESEQRMGLMTLEMNDVVMSPYSNLFSAVIFAAALAIGVSLIAGLAVGRSFAKPLGTVIQAAEQMQKGEWPEPMKVHRKDEIGLLQTVFNDMAVALRKSQERMLFLIDADPLTGLDNHRKFQEKLEQEATRTAFSKQELSIMLIDLDRFQEYNQQHGHAAGDAILAKVAKMLEKFCPEDAAVARYGGEEFSVLLPGWDVARAEELAERIRATAETTWPAKSDKKRGLTLSIGCAQLGGHSSQYKGLVLAAELAVTRAKQLGRNRVCRFDNVPGADTDADPYQLHRFLQDGSFATITALAAAVDAKDPYTQGHSQRVAEYARDLAQYVGLPDEIVQQVYTSGTLHDVGKVGVPDAILKKPGKLTDEERAVMETHPVLGEIIVKKAPHLADTLPGVRHHHERWDGKGYPDGLAGEDIPLLGRVLAVADMFDAMTSDRPYRKGLHLWEALWEVERQAGSQLDATLAMAFVSMMRERSQWSVGA